MTAEEQQQVNAMMRFYEQQIANLVREGAQVAGIAETFAIKLKAANEEIAALFSTTHPEFAPLPVAQVLEGLKVPEPARLCAGGISGGDYLRLWPHLHATDGFFAAVWQRK